MEDLAVTLEALLDRATDVRNSPNDTAAAVEFCNLVNKEPHCSHIAAKIIANKIQSSQEWEALQGLDLLDACMKHCDSLFHAEVGKFRFLNEMIKLVSPKYLGHRTSPNVRHKVLQMMYAWTIDYSRESKIREAYDMLKKQGVIKEEPAYISSQGDSVCPPIQPRSKNTIFEDDEKSRLLQKLLQSKNPDDLQAANRLIKTMVKEDERRVEVNSRRITELESVHNNARLLSEMLDSYRPEHSSQEELELIKELHQSCERLRPNVFRLASETQDNEAMLNEVLSASDELGQVFDKYTAIIILGKSVNTPPKTNAVPATSLLDLSTPSQEKLPPVSIDLLENQLSIVTFNLDTTTFHKESEPQPSTNTPSPQNQSNYDVLGDIFASMEPMNVTSTSVVHPILQPVNMQQQQTSAKIVSSELGDVREKSSKLRALEDLDTLGESMLKQSLPTSCQLGSQFTKPAMKVPMNLMGKSLLPDSLELNSTVANVPGEIKPSGAKSGSNLDLDFLIGGAVKTAAASFSSDVLNGDDSMVDLTDEGPEINADVQRVVENSVPVASINSSKTTDMPSVQAKKVTISTNHEEKRSVPDSKQANVADSPSSTIISTPVKKLDVKPLTDVFVSLDSIKPGNIPPLTALDERNGVSVILHFAKDTPRPDVSVIVVSTISKNSSTLTNYLFQAVVPKTCKLRLQPPSSTELPAHSPFLPPSAITQVMLIANPNKDLISLKFILSYLMDDETITEMGEVEQLPVLT